jgi:hypothetical protein
MGFRGVVLVATKWLPKMHEDGKTFPAERLCDLDIIGFTSIHAQSSRKMCQIILKIFQREAFAI